MRWIDNILYSGGNDNKVCTFSTPDMAPLKTYSFESSIKSIDCFNGKLLVGQSSGKLIVCDAANDADQQCIQNSHNDGEVWGLCQSSTNADMVISCGDDNRVICWDTKNRKCAGEKTITTDKNDVKGASSQSKKPSSQ
jgi:WD40 repeat protein